MHWLNRIERASGALARLSGGIAVVAMLAMLLMVFTNVVKRYALDSANIGMQELEWHLFAIAFLFGVPYAMHHNSHVRVDILYERWTDRRKAWINLFGTVVFVWPFCLLLIAYGYDFSLAAWDIGEGSGDPGGLPKRWLIKAAMPASFVLILLVSLSYLTQALKVLIYGERYPDSSGAHLS